MGSPMNAWCGDHLGTYHSLSTIDRSGGEADGTRSYSVTGYLLPNAQRANLRVLTESLVERLVISNEGAVSGVEFEHGGKSHKVLVKKEVVLSAGVVRNTVHLLLDCLYHSSRIIDLTFPLLKEQKLLPLIDHPVSLPLFVPF